MNASEIVENIKSELSEWIEMYRTQPFFDEDQFLISVLSNKIVSLNDEIEYLKKRLDMHNKRK